LVAAGPWIQLFHIWPMNPACGLESWKLARLAAAAASVELRFWLTRPAKATPWEGLRSEGDLASAAMFEGGDPEEDILMYGGVQLISGGSSVLI